MKYIKALSSIKSIHLILLLLFIIAGSNSLLSSPLNNVISIDGSKEKYKINKYIEILEDKDGKLTIDDIRSKKINKLFKLNKVKIPNYGYTNSAYWVKLKVKFNKKIKEKHIIELAYPLMDHVQFYKPLKQNKYEVIKSGDDVPFNNREIKHRHYLFTMPNNIKTQTYYFRFQTTGTFRIILNISPLISFIDEDFDRHYILGIYYGIFIVMFVIYLLIFISFRDISYLYFSLFIASYGIFQSIENGVLFELLKPDSIPWKYQVYLILGMLSLLTSIRFAQHFLFLKKNAPILNNILNFMMGAGLTLLAFCAFTDDYFTVEIQLFAVYAIISVTIFPIVGFIMLIRGYRPAALFITAWTLFYTGVAIFALQSFAIIESTDITIYIMQITSLSVVTLLSVGMVDRINIMQKEKESAQSQALENEKITRQTQEKMIEHLHEMSILKDQFLANTSHELRTPLNGIIGIAESLNDGICGPMPEEVKYNLSMIVTSGKRLLNIVNDILDFTKLKNKDIILNQEPIDIRSISDVIIELTKPLLKDKNVKIINRIDENAPLVNADENRIYQIMMNLMSNAIKFTHSGTITLWTRQNLIKTDMKDKLEIGIEDTGIGIEKHLQEKIFEAFEQADGSISKNYHGSGLGLSITKKLVELHDGNIKVSSSPGEGSAFIFSLPIAQEQEKTFDIKLPDFFNTNSIEDIPKDQIDDSTELYKSTSIKDEESFTIMIVDDDRINLQVLDNYLSSKKFKVIKALSGIEALGIIEESEIPDLILLDIMMPQMSGYEVLDILRKKFPIFKLPIILLSAKNQIDDIVTGLKKGANDYLPKPFDKNELYARVETLLMLKYAVEEKEKFMLLQEQLSVASDIQFSTLPKSLPVLDKITASARYIPMDSIGGDFYDYHMPDENSIGFFISDVSGHGIPAALIASMTKIVFSMHSLLASKPGELLSSVNRALFGNIEERFITASYVYIDQKKYKATFGRAGHEPLLVYRKYENTIEEFLPKGSAIGLFDEINVKEIIINIEKGDKIIIYSDGITEACNKEREFFELERLNNHIINNSNLNSQELNDSIINELEKWTESSTFQDDVTLIVIDIG